MKPYWSRTEFFCGLFYSDRKSDRFVDMLTERFRQKFDITGVVIPTSSGGTAFELALKVLKNIHPTRKRVIIPTYGCRATFDPIVNAGLVPVFADIDKNLNISVESVRYHMTDDVLAMLVPHLCGCKAEIEELVSIAKQKHVVVIEDVCQSLGGTDSGLFLGKRGDMTIFSFGRGKNLMATAGGMLTSNIYMEDLLNEAQKLTREDIRIVRRRFRKIVLRDFIGFEFRIERFLMSSREYKALHPLDAKLMCVQLDKLEEVLEKRKANAKRIIEVLRKTGLRVALQEGEAHIYTRLSVIFEYPQDCRRLEEALHAARVVTDDMYSPLHLKPFAAEFSSNVVLPYSERIYKNIFNVPVRPNLSEKQLDKIVKAIGNVGGEKS